MQCPLAILFSLLSLTAEAQTQTLRVWPLQFHCATQGAEANKFIAYGTLAYLEPGRSNNSKVNVAFFQTALTKEEFHPFCAKISAAIANQRDLLVTVSSEQKLKELTTLSE